MGTFWGGLDLAQRVDHSALIVLELEDNQLHQVVEKVWPHIDYSFVFNDIEKYNRKIPFNRIGYDRTGVGDGLKHLMRPRNIFFPIVTTNNMKVQIINLINGLFQDGRLHIQEGTDLEKQMKEQQFQVTDAGNIKYNHPSGKHDDVFWAAGYACYMASSYMSGIIKPTLKSARNDYRDNLDDRIDAEIEALVNSEI